MKKFNTIIIFLLLGISIQLNATEELWSHIKNTDILIKNGVEIELFQENGEVALNMLQTKKSTYASVAIPAPEIGWNLSNTKFIEAEITNTSTNIVEIILWVVPDLGWDAVGRKASIEPGESMKFQCNLRANYADGTPKLNPERIQKIEVMFSKASVGASIQIKHLICSGVAKNWIMPSKRMEVANMEIGTFGAGKRTRFQLAENAGTQIYSALYLPKTWNRNKKYPVIVEFPGNLYYTGSVHSTGRPEQCTIGYGMSKNEEVIWVSVPFVDYNLKKNIEDGWGNADNTVDYTLKMVNEIVSKFGGDKDNIVLTGFSRGAIACGYIGLRNDTIAALWKGFHVCQHYDGDGWHGASMVGAKERAKRIKNRPVFETDNNQEELKAMFKEAGINVSYASSGLKSHATAMFLDDRPSTINLRNWYTQLIHSK